METIGRTCKLRNHQTPRTRHISSPWGKLEEYTESLTPKPDDARVIQAVSWWPTKGVAEPRLT